MARHKDTEWNVLHGGNKNMPHAGAAVCVLMDIRDELKKLNRLLHCSNFTAIPAKLDAIAKNTERRRRGKK